MSCLNVTTLAGALDALAADPGALVLAGGTDLLVEINMGHRRPTSVLSVTRVPELRSWAHDPSNATVRLGAAVTYAEVMEHPLAGLLPALAQAARTVGSPQIRNTATVGGNVGTSSPAGDGLPVLAALEAVVHLASATGVREVPFAEFATAPKRTVRRPDELITAITVPVLTGWQGYSKVGVRNAMVIATASTCLAVDEAAGNVRLALGSVGPVIIRASAAEAFARASVDFAERRATADTVREFAALAAAAARPIDDHRSTAAYRRHAIGVLAGRLLRRAFPNG
ncbi:MAG: putative xanthine dehydrogenase FAD-binding subunit [Ilumatobacteraceae bacterium]|nr:putative xanthine dehydrogenase FAD-binding subunit [Ilumatobacteraceae bacterium]